MSHKSPSSLRASAAILVLATLACGQSRLPTHRLKNEALTPIVAGGYGSYIHGLDDIDGDGWADYAVAAPSYPPFAGALGRIYLYSGRSSAVIWTIDGVQPSASFGAQMLSIPDVNFDGVPDILISSPGFNSGMANNAGRVSLHSGMDGGTLWDVDGTQVNGHFGEALGVAGNSSMAGAVVVGEPGRNLPIGTGAGRVVYLNPINGLFISDELSPFAFSAFGRTVAARLGVGGIWAGTGTGRVFRLEGPNLTVNGPTEFLPPVPGSNGAPQLALIAAGPGTAGGLAVGRSFFDPAGVPNGGRVDYFGASATPLLTIEGTSFIEGVGAQLIAIRDWDGDGVEELGFASTDPVVSTTTRFRIVTIGGLVREDMTRTSGGQRFATIPDVTGDGRGELLVGMSSGLSLESEATLFSQGLGPASFALGTGGALTVTQRIELTPAYAGAGYLQVYGGTGAAPGTSLFPGAPLLALVPDAVTDLGLSLVGTPVLPQAAGTLDASGFATTTFNLPGSSAAALAGLTLYTAVLAVDANQVITVASNPRAISMP